MKRARERVIELLSSFKEVMEFLRENAPGTPLNSRQHIPIGLRAQNAIEAVETLEWLRPKHRDRSGPALPVDDPRRKRAYRPQRSYSSETKERAREMASKGIKIKDIAESFGVSPKTASDWCKDIRKPVEHRGRRSLSQGEKS